MTHSTRSLCQKDLEPALFGSSLHLEYENKDSPMLPCHAPEALARAASIQVSLTMLRGDFLPVTLADWISKWLLSSLALSLICMVTTRSAMTASKPTTVVYSSIGYTNRPGGVRPSVTGCSAPSYTSSSQSVGGGFNLGSTRAVLRSVDHTHWPSRGHSRPRPGPGRAGPAAGSVKKHLCLTPNIFHPWMSELQGPERLVSMQNKNLGCCVGCA